MLPREAFCSYTSQSAKGIHEPRPINTRLIARSRPRQTFLSGPPFLVPVVAALAAATSIAVRALGTGPYWHRWFFPIAFTEDEFLRDCVLTPR